MNWKLAIVLSVVAIGLSAYIFMADILKLYFEFSVGKDAMKRSTTQLQKNWTRQEQGHFVYSMKGVAKEDLKKIIYSPGIKCGSKADLFKELEPFDTKFEPAQAIQLVRQCSSLSIPFDIDVWLGKKPEPPNFSQWRKVAEQVFAWADEKKSLNQKEVRDLAHLSIVLIESNSIGLNLLGHHIFGEIFEEAVKAWPSLNTWKEKSRPAFCQTALLNSAFSDTSDIRSMSNSSSRLHPASAADFTAFVYTLLSLFPDHDAWPNDHLIPWVTRQSEWKKHESFGAAIQAELNALYAKDAPDTRSCINVSDYRSGTRKENINIEDLEYNSGWRCQVFRPVERAMQFVIQKVADPGWHRYADRFCSDWGKLFLQ